MIITKVDKQRNNEKRYSIYIDDKFSFGLSEEDLIYFNIKQYQEITEQRYNYIMEYVIYTKAKDKAYRFLGYKSRTEKELKEKLMQELYPEEIIERIIELFKRYNYINDETYAKGHINNRIKFKPMSKKMMRYELIKKGVDNEIIDNTLEKCTINEINMAVELLHKKLKNKKYIDRKEKERAYNYLLRRGFDYNTVNKAFKIVLEETIYE